MKSKCTKCGYESESNLPLFGLPLCTVCMKFAPKDPEQLDTYVDEKIDSKSIESFRKHSSSAADRQKKAMIKKASLGSPMSRPPFGYKFLNGELIPAENFREIEEIFEEFLTQKISLTQLSKKHNLSVNGLKKVLKNFTYIGKIKFNNQIHDGKHNPIISSTLFNHVQNKLERLSIKQH